jgi:hypothetical protein
MFRGVGWYVVTDVSGQRIGSMFKGQAIQEGFEAGTGYLSRNVGGQLPAYSVYPRHGGSLVSRTLILLISIKFSINLFSCSEDVACGRMGGSAGGQREADVAKHIFTNFRYELPKIKMC